MSDQSDLWRRLAPLILLLGCLFASAAMAQDSEGDSGEAALDYSRQGADSCLKCHDETSEFPVLSIFKTPHAVTADERTPFANLQCESCHGPGEEHGKRLRFNQERPPIPAFGDNAIWSTERQNGICLGCHQDSQAHWQGSTHQGQEVGCADCHQVHAEHDPVTVTAEQPSVCFECHTAQRAQSFQTSSHPIRFGEMDCSGCHQAHGSLTEAELVRPTINETCFQCHAEKRGPVLWEHAPVAEDCSLCHRPHGSNHPVLLNKPAPLLCQQCHARAGHPSIGFTANGLPRGQPSAFLLNGSCSNCHSQVHGSNHPSGASLLR